MVVDMLNTVLNPCLLAVTSHLPSLLHPKTLFAASPMCLPRRVWHRRTGPRQVRQEVSSYRSQIQAALEAPLSLSIARFSTAVSVAGGEERTSGVRRFRWRVRGVKRWSRDGVQGAQGLPSIVDSFSLLS